jgi:nucleoid-associated protein YgaU
MTDPAVKAALGLCVLLAGVCAAMLFRRDQPLPAAPEASGMEKLLLRFRAEARAECERALDAGRPAAPANNPPPASMAPRPATVVTASERREPPPSLSPAYPARNAPAGQRWGTSKDVMMPVTAPAVRIHKVVDGDTLPALAEHYLGSAAGADEIYQANRDKLNDPRLLPIGVELKLPPRNR